MKNRYVVGHSGDGECVYGRDGLLNNSMTSHWIDPISFAQAKRARKRLMLGGNNHGDTRKIFKLVEVK